MAEKHKCTSHAFTIREYANKMRRKKWEDDETTSRKRRRRRGGGGGLHKVVVPKYRWWRCKECVAGKSGEVNNYNTTTTTTAATTVVTAAGGNYNNNNEIMKLRNEKTIQRPTTPTTTTTRIIPSEKSRELENNNNSSFRMPNNPDPNPTTLPLLLLSHCTAAAQNVVGSTTDNALSPPPPPAGNKDILIREAEPSANDANYQSLRIRSSSHSSSTPIITLGGSKAPPTLHNNPSTSTATSIITLGKPAPAPNNADFSDDDDDDDEDHDDDTESDEDIKKLRMDQLMARTRKPDIRTRIDNDTLKGGAYGSYRNQSSSAHRRLSPGTNFQPRRNIAIGFPIHTTTGSGSSTHINTPIGLPVGSPATTPSMTMTAGMNNNRGSEPILPRPKFFSYPHLPSSTAFNLNSSNNNLTFHPQQHYNNFPTGISNLGESSTLQPPVVGTPLYAAAPMSSFNPQQQSTRLMLQLSQLGTTRQPPMTTDNANNTTCGGMGVLHKNQASSQVKVIKRILSDGSEERS